MVLINVGIWLGYANDSVKLRTRVSVQITILHRDTVINVPLMCQKLDG